MRAINPVQLEQIVGLPALLNVHVNLATLALKPSESIEQHNIGGTSGEATPAVRVPLWAETTQK